MIKILKKKLWYPFKWFIQDLYERPLEWLHERRVNKWTCENMNEDD